MARAFTSLLERRRALLRLEAHRRIGELADDPLIEAPRLGGLPRLLVEVSEREDEDVLRHRALRRLEVLLRRVDRLVRPPGGRLSVEERDRGDARGDRSAL